MTLKSTTNNSTQRLKRVLQLCFLIAGILTTRAASAVEAGRDQQSPPTPVIQSISDLQTLELDLPDGTDARTELPPSVIPGSKEGSRFVYLPTAYDYMCGTMGNPLEVPVQLNANQCGVVALPATQSNPLVYVAPNPANDVPFGDDQWQLNYDGIDSAQITRDTIHNRDIVLTIDHGETKNEEIPDGKVVGGLEKYQSPFAPLAATLPKNCGYDGYTGGGPQGFQTCYPSYGAFVSVEWNDLSLIYSTNSYDKFRYPHNNADIGPVIWPTNGYYVGLGSANQATQLSIGIRSDSSIIVNGYLYIYYFDTSKGQVGSSGLSTYGTKVARARIMDNGLPGPFYVWDGDDFKTPALPAGFDKSNLGAFISVPGPQVPSLFAKEALGNANYPLQTDKFSVAYDPTRQVYVGVEDYVSYADKAAVHNYALRLSNDLVHWSPRVPISISAEAQKTFRYPMFVNASFTSNNAVDLGNLFIIGTSGGAVQYLRLNVRCNGCISD